MNPWGQMAGGNSPQMGYPTLPNSYGIGAQIGQTGGGAGQASPTDFAGSAGPTTSQSFAGMGAPSPTTSSNGFNPWSMVGEANARG